MGGRSQQRDVREVPRHHDAFAELSEARLRALAHGMSGRLEEAAQRRTGGVPPVADHERPRRRRLRRDPLQSAWTADPVELFFLQIQGSGQLRLETGEQIRLGYADQNGHPYRSLGRLLVERGELPLENASMQGIKAWAAANPHKLREALHHNASYVFFRELPAASNGPPGALGVPLTARRSIAVDPRHVPLGAPVFIATTWPMSSRALNRLMLAQDTGGAIRGPVRADFFWGHGEPAAREAGRMKQRLRMWVLLPNDFRL